VIESCVNAVGVDLNTASVPLLRHVSGLNQLVAREIVEYRTKHGAFKNRDELKQVPQLGDVRFTQAAGFLKIRNSADPLDNTWIHPESYPVAQAILAAIGHTSADLADRAKLDEVRGKLNTIDAEALGTAHNLSAASIHDLCEAIAKPGRDAREGRPAPIFRTGVLNLEDLKAGMELKGEILNVVDFGAFVDVGLKDSGLIHISQMANRYIKSPYDVVNVGDVVSVWVNSVDPERKRVSLSLIAPGQERVNEPRPPRGERPPREPRGEQQQRPQREPRPDRPDNRPQRGPDRVADRGPDRSSDRGGRPPQQQRPSGERAGFIPRPAPSAPPLPPPLRSGQGRPAGLYRGPQPTQINPPGPAPAAAPAGEVAPAPKPRNTKPSAKLSSQQKTGRADLNTFAQLAALLGGPAPEAPKPEKPKKKQEAPPEAPPVTEAPPAQQEPPAE